MRLLDLLHPHLDGVHTIVEVRAGEIDLGPYLHLPDGVAHVRRDVREILGGAEADGQPGDAGFGTGVLVLTLGPGAADDSGETCRRIIERLRPGARGVILFGHPPAELPYHLLLDDLVAAGCQVLQAASLEYAHLRSGIAFAAVEEVQPPRDYFGRATIIEPVMRHRTLLRAVNEYVLADIVTREMRARLADLEWAAGRAGHADPDGSPDLRGPERSGADSQELTQLRTTLADRQAQVRRLEDRLAAVERSTKLRIGQAFADAARHPARGAVALPRQLYRLWRRREMPASGSVAAKGFTGESAPARAAADPGSVSGLAAEERRLLQHTAVSLGLRDRPVIAGIMRDETCAALEADAVVNQMLPHDALLVLERSEPDVVLVETAAAAGGPWAYLGNLVAVDRDTRLAELIAAARALGRPVVLCRNAPAHVAPGLVRFEGGDSRPSGISFDAVFGDLGVQLAQMGPVDLDPDRPRDPVYVGPRDAREPVAVRRLIDEVLAAEVGLRVVEPSDSRQRAAVHRGNAVFLAASRRQVLEQLAAGGRVVAASDQLPDDELRAHVTVVGDPEHAVKELRAAAEAGPRESAEARAALRALFHTSTVRARLGELTRRLGLPVDPLGGRRVAVLAHLADAAEAARFADAVLRQQHRPAEVVVHARADVGRALEELAAASVGVRRASGSSPRDLAAAADSPLAMPWSAGRDYPGTYLLDLVCAQECSRADVVGHPGSGSSADYVFVPTLVPALVRRDLLVVEPLDGVPTVRQAEAWGRRGRRLFAISP